MGAGRENPYLLFSECISDPLIIIDSEGNIQFQNNSATDILNSYQVSCKLKIKSGLVKDWEQIYILFSKNRNHYQVIPVENDNNEIVHLRADILHFKSSALFLVRIIKISSEKQFHTNLTNSFHSLLNIFNEFNKPLMITDKAGNIIKLNESFIELFNELNDVDEYYNLDQVFDSFNFKMNDLVNYYHSIGKNNYGEFLVEIIKKPSKRLKLLSIYNEEFDLLITTFSTLNNESTSKSSLYEGMRLLGESTARIIHEINNPLTTLKGYVELLRSKKEFDGSYLEIIQNELKKIETLTTDLLYLSNPKSDFYYPIQITEIVEQVVQLFEIRLQSINCSFFYSIDLPYDTFVYGNELRLKQVMINLLKNSIEALEEQECQRLIEVIVMKQYDQVTIKIKDNGPGIDDDRIQKIFQPFYTSKETGSGLGLSISEQLIKEHNGTLNIRSAVEGGTEAIITLPEYKILTSEYPMTSNELNYHI